MNPLLLKVRNLALLGLTATTLASAQTVINATNYVTVAGTGALIPDPTLALKTSVTRDGTTATFLEGMAYVPAGTTADGAELAAFAIGYFEVTNAEWLEFVDQTGRTPPAHWLYGVPPVGKLNHPVVNVSWHDAVAYCAWLSAKTGLKIALPTTAQWEKAARGPEAWRYPWGPDAGVTTVEGRLSVRFNHNAVCATSVLATQPGLTYSATPRITTNPTTHAPLGADRRVATSDVLRVSATGVVSNWDNRNSYADFVSSDEAAAVNAGGGYTQAVGTYVGGASYYGCHDLAGNVAEWTRSAGGTSAVRGGSWASSAAACSSVAAGETLAPGTTATTVGFRIVCNFPATATR